MHAEQTVIHFATMAREKRNLLYADPTAFLITALLAGAYVGVGIVLIFTLGQTADPSWRNLVMGASFGIALTLVVFAGSDLFTGHTMYGAHGYLAGSVGLSEVAAMWITSWAGNLAGSVLLAILVVVGGGGILFPEVETSLIQAVAAKKMAGTAPALIAKGILCNWLVCLALWTSARVTSDTAKCILIFWCLFAFIAAAFEHSVANMTVFSLALLWPHGAGISIRGAAWNLLWVTLGNLLSGTLFLGWAYWRHAGKPRVTN